MTPWLLSCYVAPPGEQALLSTRYDQSVALWRVDGGSLALERHWEIERLSGRKHHGWPLVTVDAIDELLSSLLSRVGLTLDDIDVVCGIPGVGDNRRIEAIASRFPDVSLHSLGHLAAVLLTDGEHGRSHTVVGAVMDALPDWALGSRRTPCWYAGGVVIDGRLEVVGIESPAILYTAASMVMKAGPGALMALADASRCAVPGDISLIVDEEYVAAVTYGRDLRTSAVQWILNLRASASELLAADADAHGYDPALTFDENVHSAVMKLVRSAASDVAERSLRSLLDRLAVDPTTSDLAVTGAYAVDCKAVTALAAKLGFRCSLAHPTPNDSAQALGLGLLHALGSGLAELGASSAPGARTGDPLDDVEAALEEFHDAIRSVDGFDPEVFLADIARGPVAWLEGRAGAGPRDIGMRALLADPRERHARDAVNHVKGRRPWTPLCGVVLEDHVADWFRDGRPSSYMREAFELLPDRAALVPGLGDAFGAVRVHTVPTEEATQLARALRAFLDATGIPALGATSLNGAGEPIADTCGEAFDICQRLGVETVYVKGERVAFDVSDPAPDRAPRRRPLAGLYERTDSDRVEIWKRLNEKGFDTEAVFVASQVPERRALLADGSAGADRLGKFARLLRSQNPDSFDRGLARFVSAVGLESRFTTSPDNPR